MQKARSPVITSKDTVSWDSAIAKDVKSEKQVKEEVFIRGGMGEKLSHESWDCDKTDE